MGNPDMDFSNEGPHSARFIVQGDRPFNAEPRVSDLVEFEYTPEELVYCRNHSPIFDLDEESYTIKVDGLVKQTMALKLKDLKERFEQVEVVAALQCAGNRRKEMGEIKPVKGIAWDNAVIANCCWRGARLRDILLQAGVTAGEDLHVWFASESVSTCQDDSCYGGSIPLERALDPESDVLLALKMNRQILSPDHGYPLRVVIPGCTGARWVKWVDRITVAKGESPNFYQQRDYKILPPDCINAEMAAPLWAKCQSIYELPVNSVIANVLPVPTEGNDSMLKLKGYAMGGNSQIADVEVAIQAEEGHEEWVKATITYQEGKWSWTLWECLLDVRLAKAEVERKNGVCKLTLLCRARDKNGEEQKRDCAWNMRGVAFNAYGKWVLRW